MKNASGHFLTCGGSWSEGRIMLARKDEQDGEIKMKVRERETKRETENLAVLVLPKANYIPSIIT